MEEMVESIYPKWKNIPELSDLKQLVDDAHLDVDNHATNVTKWLNNLYPKKNTTNNKNSSKVNRSQLQPKLIRKQAEWRYASLSEPFLSTPDIFNVYPKSAGDVKRAEQNQLVLNNQFNTQLDKVYLIDSYVRSLVNTGTAVIKTGWETEEEEEIKKTPIYNFIPDTTGQLAKKYMLLLEMKAQNNEEYYDYVDEGIEQALILFIQKHIAYIPQPTGEFKITKTITEVKNQPTVEVLDSRNIIVDPTCDGNLQKARFVAERFKTSLTELKRDGNYINLDQIELKEDLVEIYRKGDQTEEVTDFNFKDKPKKQFIVTILWIDWDVDDTGLTKPIVIAWVGNTIVRMQDNPFPDKRPPYVCVAYMPTYNSIYGEPDGELLEDNQKVIGAVTRGMIDLLGRSANSQTGMRKDMLDIVNRRKYNEGQHYEFNANVDPRQGIYTHTFPEIPQSAYNMLNIQNAEAESLSGVKAFSSGLTGSSLGENVGNGRSVLDAASKREVGILRRMAEGLIQVGRKIISMNAIFLSEEEVVRITSNQFIKVRRDDLAGNFDLRLTISTPEEDNEKAKELAFMLQTSAPNSDPGEVRLIRAEIARLRKMPALAKRIEEYRPEPDPIAQKKVQLEILLLEAQIAKERALGSKHGAEAGMSQLRGIKEGAQAELNQAKIGTEQAKAKQLSSDADLKDLGFLEQESGVHQARKLQQMSKQAEHDQETKILDSALQHNKSKGGNDGSKNTRTN